ncbi:MAG: hypothetical protein KAQ63_00860 [Candidatus Moranbacteria bacterium]|nr:hypothetical protein [Candidatus Moranbacteria bacterium]
MKKIIVGLVLVVGAIGLFSLVAVAKNDKASAQSNAPQKDSVDKTKGQVVRNVEDDQAVNSNGKATQTSTNNAGEDKNLRNTISGGDEVEGEDVNGKGNSKAKSADELKGSAAKVVKGLKDVAEDEPKIGKKLAGLAEDQEAIQDEVIGAVEKIEKQNKAKVFLLGTDYKNLGQLRSTMVQNRNQIRQLIQLMDQVEDGENKLALQEQLSTMMEERTGIVALIEENESSFSLFGWAFRLMNGYSNDSVDEAEEAELEEEVEEALGTMINE